MKSVEDCLGKQVKALEAENAELRAKLHELTKKPWRTFNAFVAEAKGLTNWCVAHRSTPALRDRYSTILTPKRYAELEAEHRAEWHSDYQ